MTLQLLLRRPRPPFGLTSLVSSSHFLTRLCSFCSRAFMTSDEANAAGKDASLDFGDEKNVSAKYRSDTQLLASFGDGRPHLGGYNIELVDNDAWQVSSGLAHAWRELGRERDSNSVREASDERVDVVSPPSQGDHDFDEIDNMRIRGNLFYKLDRDSKEFEEYSFDFHRTKSAKRKDDPKKNEKRDSSKKADDHKETKKKENPSWDSPLRLEKFPQIVKDEKVYTLLENVDGSGAVEKKKVRTPTFNQLTAPYHEPFCLDIFISKASVRASVIHRVTSKVVAVAHSISKDMKFDLSSTRNASACAAVGRILAQRALEDDIHDIVYTPRKGERLEGKLQIVLQSIIDSGINVKVKLKQPKPKKSSLPFTS